MVVLIVAGIAIGPSGLGIVTLDLPIQILALIGLAFLLFLAGLEVEVHEMRGRRLRLALASFGLSFALALALGAGLAAVGLVDAPVLVAVILVGTSLGVVIPVLKDAGEIEGDFGPLVTGDRDLARSYLEPVVRHLADAGLGTVSECFEPEPPHEPRACIAQAWGVAEILRAWRALDRPVSLAGA